jgi:hypothetical protein
LKKCTALILRVKKEVNESNHLVEGFAYCSACSLVGHIDLHQNVGELLLNLELWSYEYICEKEDISKFIGIIETTTVI